MLPRWNAQAGLGPTVTTAVHIAPRRGQQLPEELRRQAEELFDTDLSDVRIFLAPKARKMGVRAFTSGSSIYLAPGEHAPGSARWVQLLGHELAHVIQQRSRRARNPYGYGVAVLQDPGLEAEAHQQGHALKQRLQARDWLPVQRMDASLQLNGQPISNLSDEELVVELVKYLGRKNVRKWLSSLEQSARGQLQDRLKPGVLTMLNEKMPGFMIDWDNAMALADGLPGASSEETGYPGQSTLSPGTGGPLAMQTPEEAIFLAEGIEQLKKLLDAAQHGIFVDSASGLKAGTHRRNKQDYVTVSLFRNMSREEWLAAEAEKKLPDRIIGTDYYKWLTESYEKARTFVNAGDTSTNRVIAEFVLDGDQYLEIRTKVLNQFGRSQINEIIYHQEGIRPESWLINIGVPSAKMELFNKAVLDVKIVT